MYSLFCFAQFFFHVICAVLTVVGVARASRTLHQVCIEKFLNAPLRYFEETPSGRLLSRFGTDLSQIDSLVCVYLEEMVGFSFNLLMLGIVIIIRNPFMLPFLTVASVAFWIPCVAGFRTRAKARKLANAAMGPLFSNLTEMQAGRSNIIRVMDLGSFFTERHYEFQDAQTCYNHIGMETMNFGRFAVDLSNTVLVSVAVATCLLSDTSPQNTGIILSYSILFGKLSQLCNSTFSQLFTWGVNLERMLELMEGSLPQEQVGGKTFDDLWPARGEIEFRNVSLRYRQGAPLILKGLNIRIAAGERVGIVGRTGAGKSSLVTCLFRLVDSTLLGGEIYLDGLDTCQVSLTTLRRGLAMIPQEPVLMEGTARKNLDPFEEFDDLHLNKALQSAHLGHVNLDSTVVGSGMALSAGEQQLLCFARVLLLQRRVIVMDEPTAAIDPQTDAKIQTLLRQSFHGASVLCVAHRLQTVLDYHRILVMSDGCVAEEGPAEVLLKRPGSLLSQFHNAAKDEPQQTSDTEITNDCKDHCQSSLVTNISLPGCVDTEA
eukprot:gnl/MRDRNA2_/MRDRNA2_136604_c0_seq1.p1 gnl/MRDRNA2_/MRDRNA2_136604_c0~~gnl/MRDRNA2_/MRDRNA2_136604_c0_seq1.p1  ORF type:complete len:553 (-),score=76.95 gnl/MRDRNA2_/MRDRNA2_136604_c0_seq1:38-1672(-)